MLDRVHVPSDEYRNLYVQHLHAEWLASASREYLRTPWFRFEKRRKLRAEIEHEAGLIRAMEVCCD